MPFFVSRRELKRLERELAEARKARVSAEERLEVEREAKDKLALALLDHVAVRDKGYPISTRLPQPEEAPQVETSEQYLERLKVEYAPTWDYYRQVAAQSGKSETDALDWLVRHAEGRPMPFEQEM